MAEYIEREAVLPAVENAVELYPSEYDEIKSHIKAIPAADVAPVVHGRWDIRYDGTYGRARAYCTACGRHSGIGGIRSNQLKLYCPNCGAKMQEAR